MNRPRPPAVPPAVLQLQPIGFARTPFTQKSAVPRQPALAADVEGTLELLESAQMADALADLEGFSHVWVIFWFHEAKGWRPKVLPPRSTVKRGVLATRSPHRPNPLGLSVLKLVRVEGTTLHVRGVDMLDGTPVLDVKPYVPYADVVQASSGWLGEQPQASSASSVASAGVTSLDLGPSFEVGWSPLAEEQLAFLGAHGPRLRDDAERVLSAGPAPHPYRRIRRDGDRLRLSVRDLRIYFTLHGQRVQIDELSTGYRASALADPRSAPSADIPLELHRAFVARFGRVAPRRPRG
jgi:tRNA-Thr(GGU) m(6)t(6)A37 methyltransferase TsaA